MKLKKISNQKQVTKSESIEELNNNIIALLDEILRVQSQIINEEVSEILEKVDLLITECHTDKRFKTIKSEKYNRLVYEYQSLKLKYESYKINEQIKKVENNYKEIRGKQEQIKNETNNLVYNILGFIASFSIVSAAVAAITQVNGIANILLFMAFSILLLLTTLIGLHNFYKNNNSDKKWLQNNYFLWKMMVIVIVLLVGYKGIIFIKENKQEIFESIGRGIGKIISENKK